MTLRPSPGVWLALVLLVALGAVSGVVLLLSYALPR